MDENTMVILAAAIICLSALLYRPLATKLSITRLPSPPGPRGAPLLGNVADIPRTQPWTTFAKWGEIYGGIVRVSALGRSIIVLNDAKFAIEMLDKKGRIYSERPTLTAAKLAGWGDSPALIPFCDTWTEYRKLLAQFMGTRSKVEEFGDLLQGETHNLLVHIYENPVAWIKHARRFASAIVLMLAYGYKVTDEDDKMVIIVNEVMDQFSELSTGNAFLVDVFPILRYVPEWFPGAAWKKKVSRYRRTLQDVLNLPFDWANERIAEGTSQPCFVSNIIGNRQLSDREKYVLKWAAVGIYAGGAETTVAGIESLVLGLTIHTSAQQRAQAELDSVIGAGRLPTLADRAHLPYVEALLAELLRTYIFGPIGLPHALREDDVHNGYFIPKGSTMITNTWQFCKDPKTYANPEAFSPERFMNSARVKETDPKVFLFGFGRRICPGIRLADASLWLAFVSMLVVFDIRPAVKDGKPVPPSGRYMDGLISHPEPFDCTIRPRSPAAEALILSA